MNVSIEEIKYIDSVDYVKFIKSCDECTIYHSSEFIRFINAAIPKSSFLVIVIKENNKIVGSIPFFILSAKFGTVLNSLPYYGSYGGFISLNKNSHKYRKIAFEKMADFCKVNKISSVNVIGSPFDEEIELASESIDLKRWDSRIGQVSVLPDYGSVSDVYEGILKNCNQKTRNLVRKGVRSGFSISISDDWSDWIALQHHHEVSMHKIGGRAKKLAEFEALRNCLMPVNGCKLFVARKEGVFAGALLNLYFRNCVEYFTPVSVDEFRNEQVISALISSAMTDAVRNGMRIWNWGGTWSTQLGVHHFKQGWGAKDSNYGYYGRVFNEEINKASRDELTQAYESFYVRPFSAS